MKCFYINLEAEVGRRSYLEKNFSEIKKPDWMLIRHTAIDSRRVAEIGTKGKIRDSEKACFLSHRGIIQENARLESDAVLIVEDDTRFGPHSCQLIEDSLRVMTGTDWDLLFTDVTIPRPETMIGLIPLCNQLIAERKTKILNLKALVFAGSGAYIVNGRSIGKLLCLLNAAESIDTPYDLYLRKLIYEDKLKGFVTFPFVTTISEAANHSQIQTAGSNSTNLIWNAFRRLSWLERSTEELEPLVRFIESQLCDEDTKLFSPIIAACLSRGFVSK